MTSLSSDPVPIVSCVYLTNSLRGSFLWKIFKMSRLLSSYQCAQRLVIRSALPARAVFPCATQHLRRGYASASPISTFDWEDPLVAKNLLTEDELAISDTAERYCQDYLLPRVLRTKRSLRYACQHC